ncbi:class I tRNA ligase family protein [bacterium]|nr:MAG: class I tRNA ligase family protein [bacterium]
MSIWKAGWYRPLKKADPCTNNSGWFFDEKEMAMKKAVQPDFPAFEAEILKTWESEKTFQASLEARKQGQRFSFYDGPPFANGKPHYGHILAATIKDSITRYKTMRGYYVPRRLGWDTHGLPVEYEVEKN